MKQGYINRPLSCYITFMVDDSARGSIEFKSQQELESFLTLVRSDDFQSDTRSNISFRPEPRESINTSTKSFKDSPTL